MNLSFHKPTLLDLLEPGMKALAAEYNVPYVHKEFAKGELDINDPEFYAKVKKRILELGHVPSSGSL